MPAGGVLVVDGANSKQAHYLNGTRNSRYVSTSVSLIKAVQGSGVRHEAGASIEVAPADD